MSEGEQDQSINPASQPNDLTRKQKYWGLGLSALGLVFEFLGFGVHPIFLIAGIALCGVGLAYYAKSLGRSLAWGAFALWPIGGPPVGLVVLAINKRPQVMSAAQLKRGWLQYAAGLWFFPLIANLKDGQSCIAWPNEQFPSLKIVEGSDCGFASFMLVSIIFVAGIVFIVSCVKAISAFGARSSASWLAARAVVIGVTVIYTVGAFSTAKNASRVYEARSVTPLAELRVGMTKDDVEQVILQTNDALIPPLEDPRSGISGEEKAEYQKVRDALSRVTLGQPVNFSDLHFHRVLFNINLDSLDRIGAPKASDSQVLFVRSCCQMMFRWTRFDLFVDYDQDNRLKSARYLKSDHEDGADHGCAVLLEVPADSGKQYPHPCSSNLKNSQTGDG